MRRTTAILVAVAVVLVTVLWWLFLIQPRRTQIDDFRAERDAAELEVERLQGEKARLLEIAENELSYMTAGAALERLIPPTPELAAFIDDVTVLALDSGVVLNTLTPSLPAAEAFEEFATIRMFLDVEGQFFEVLGFLYGLADMPRLVRVDGLTLTPSESEEGTIVVSAGLDAAIFTTAVPVIPEAPDEQPPAEQPAEDGETTTTTSVGEGEGE